MPFVDHLRGLLGDEALVTAAGEDGERLDLAAEVAGLHPDGEGYVCGPPRLTDPRRGGWAAAGPPAPGGGGGRRGPPVPAAAHGDLRDRRAPPHRGVRRRGPRPRADRARP